MRVILMADVARLGRAGEQVEVADGYARNYLLPRRLAVAATPGAVRSIGQLQAQGANREARARQQAGKVAEQIAATTCSLARAAGEQDRLFGSVTNLDISEALEAQGIRVDRRRILLEEPIKALGTYRIPVRLHPEVTAELTVVVAREG